MHLIDYGHMRGGVLYHGTLSDLDGGPQATWTYEDGGKPVTLDQALDDGTFNDLWNVVASADVFRRCMVRRADQEIDPERYHVVGIAFDQDGQQGQCMFLVPAEEADPEFVRWLRALNVPHGSPG